MIFHNFHFRWTSANVANETSSRKIFDGICSCGKDKFRPRKIFAKTRFQNSMFYGFRSKSTFFEEFSQTILRKHLLWCFRKMQYIFNKKWCIANCHQNFVMDLLLQFVWDSIHLSRVALSWPIWEKWLKNETIEFDLS